MRRMRNRILLSGVAALLSAAVITGPAAASSSYHSDDRCDRSCGGDHHKPRHGKGKDNCLEILGIKICLKLGVSTG
jgi:hypothetical protein